MPKSAQKRSAKVSALASEDKGNLKMLSTKMSRSGYAVRGATKPSAANTQRMIGDAGTARMHSQVPSGGKLGAIKGTSDSSFTRNRVNPLNNSAGDARRPDAAKKLKK